MKKRLLSTDDILDLSIYMQYLGWEIIGLKKISKRNILIRIISDNEIDNYVHFYSSQKNFRKLKMNKFYSIEELLGYV